VPGQNENIFAVSSGVRSHGALGKTIWELWTGDIQQAELPETLPIDIRESFGGYCIFEKYNFIDVIKREHCGK